jgi:hypothetical protein
VKVFLFESSSAIRTINLKRLKNRTDDFYKTDVYFVFKTPILQIEMTVIKPHYTETCHFVRKLKDLAQSQENSKSLWI